MKYKVIKPMKFLAMKKFADSGFEATIEWFATFQECLDWIKKQEQPTDSSWKWVIGEYE